MRVISVKLYRGRSFMEVFVKDDAGRGYCVPLSWVEAVPTDVPPKTWLLTVEAEVRQAGAANRDVLTAFRKGVR